MFWGKFCSQTLMRFNSSCWFNHSVALLQLRATQLLTAEWWFQLIWQIYRTEVKMGIVYQFFGVQQQSETATKIIIILKLTAWKIKKTVWALWPCQWAELWTTHRSIKDMPQKHEDPMTLLFLRAKLSPHKTTRYCCKRILLYPSCN